MQNERIMGHIKDICCKAYKVSYEEVMSRKKTDRIVTCRMVAFYLARRHTNQSLQEIGNYFNRPHHAVMYAIAQIEQRIKEQPQFHSFLKELGRKISFEAEDDGMKFTIVKRTGEKQVYTGVSLVNCSKGVFYLYDLKGNLIDVLDNLDTIDMDVRRTYLGYKDPTASGSGQIA